jgi:hypothetical protein
MNRRDLACAAIGVLAGAVGCSAPAKTLFVPEAEASGVTPSGVPTCPGGARIYVTNAFLEFVLSGANDKRPDYLQLFPKQKGYWKASSSDPRIAEVDAEKLRDGCTLSVMPKAPGDVTISVRGFGNETASERNSCDLQLRKSA